MVEDDGKSAEKEKKREVEEEREREMGGREGEREPVCVVKGGGFGASDYGFNCSSFPP